MHTPEEQPRDGGDIFEEVTVANVAPIRSMRFSCALTIAICHPDVPEDVPLGTVYLYGSLRQLRESFATDVSAILRDMEAGISEAGSTALSPDSDGGSIFGKGLAVEDVVPNRPVKR